MNITISSSQDKNQLLLQTEDIVNPLVETLVNQNNNRNLLSDQLMQIIQNCFLQLSEFSLALDKYTTKAGLLNKRYRTSKNVQTILLNGTRLIFALREFITQEQLTLLIGGTTQDKQLKEKSYNDIHSLFANNLVIDFTNNVMRLQHEVETLSNLTDIVNNSMLAQWNDILNFGEIQGKPDQEKVVTDDGSVGVLHKKSADMNVYAKWVRRKGSKRSELYYYYNLQNIPITTREGLKLLLNYNRGWLYQWWNEANREVFFENSNTPLYLFMYEYGLRENLPGIRGGDVGLTQIKMNNTQIISINNLRRIVNGGGSGDNFKYIGLKPSFEKLILAINNNDEIEIKQQFRNIISDFVNINEAGIKDFINNRANELFETLTKI